MNALWKTIHRFLDILNTYQSKNHSNTGKNPQAILGTSLKKGIQVDILYNIGLITDIIE